MKKLILLLVLVLLGCSNQAQNADNTQTTKKVYQLGLSDSEWNQSRGTPSDGQDTNAHQKPTRNLSNDAKAIIIYFSRSGSTELLAEKIQTQTHADMLEIVVANSYSTDYYETVKRANQERTEDGKPILNMDVPNLQQYDEIYLGYPIWGMTIAEPMASFLENYGVQLSNKTVIPFSTNGSYGSGNSISKIIELLSARAKDVKILETFTVEGNKVDQSDNNLNSWLKRIKN